MYYLIVSMFTYSAVLIPEKYGSKELCEEAGKASNMNYHYCVPAPKPTRCWSIAQGPVGKIECQ